MSFIDDSTVLLRREVSIALFLQSSISRVVGRLVILGFAPCLTSLLLYRQPLRAFTSLCAPGLAVSVFARVAFQLGILQCGRYGSAFWLVAAVGCHIESFLVTTFPLWVWGVAWSLQAVASDPFLAFAWSWENTLLHGITVLGILLGSSGQIIVSLGVHLASSLIGNYHCCMQVWRY